MAITANMTTHEGIALTDSYVRVTEAYVKKMGSDWKLVYDVLIYKDADLKTNSQLSNVKDA
jgi:hypothetical protein